jgi:hypothetical protein
MTFEYLVPVLLFCALVGISVAAAFLHLRLPARLRDDDTNSTIRLTANLFMVTTSLLLGLLLNSAKGTFETMDHNVHAYAAGLVQLDRTLYRYGPETEGLRHRMLAHAEAMRDRPAGMPLADSAMEARMDTVGDALDALATPDARHAALAQDAQQQFDKLADLRRTLMEEGSGTIPAPLILLIAAWLVAIFASLGYRAPPNAAVFVTLVAAAGLMSFALYLIMDMDAPWSGPIQISHLPLSTAVALMQP